MSEDEPTTLPRRDVLGMAVGGSAGALAIALAVPVVGFTAPRALPSAGPATVGNVEDFPPGSAKTVLVNERPVIVIRGRDGRLQAFVALCTHLRCVVGYSAERNQIECACHRGVYSIDGQNISGPPPRPLEALVVTERGGRVVIGEA